MSDQPRIYRSECGEYLCRALGGGDVEVWNQDGSIHWANDDRIKTWADERRRIHPLPYCIGGFSAEMTGQKRGSFTVHLLRCDVRKYIKPYTGNTAIEDIPVVFRRKVPWRQAPRWLKEAIKPMSEPRKTVNELWALALDGVRLPCVAAANGSAGAWPKKRLSADAVRTWLGRLSGRCPK